MDVLQWVYLEPAYTASITYYNSTLQHNTYEFHGWIYPHEMKVYMENMDQDGIAQSKLPLCFYDFYMAKKVIDISFHFPFF